MGLFANLYLIESEQIKDNEIEIKTTIYSGETGNPPFFFSWIRGNSDNFLHGYANNTIFCDTTLRPLNGYPVYEIQRLGEKTGYNSPSILFEAQYTPELNKWATVYHIILPKNFIPRRDLKPIEQPQHPYVKISNNKLILTWPAMKPCNIRFTATPLRDNESINDFNFSEILSVDKKENARLGIELNFGIIKFRFGN